MYNGKLQFQNDKHDKVGTHSLARKLKILLIYYDMYL